MGALFLAILFFFLISFIYPAAVVIWFKLHGDKRSIIEIIRKEC